MNNHLRKELKLENKLVIGYVGAIQKWQGVEQLIAAANGIKDERIVFLIVGGDDDFHKGNIIRIKKIPRYLTPSYYAACDVMVLPRPNSMATQVASPTKFAEYVAMGKPILTTNVGDASLFVKKYRCGYVTHDDVGGLIDGITHFSTLSNFDLEIMAINSRKLAEDFFNWDTIISNYNNQLHLLY